VARHIGRLHVDKIDGKQERFVEVSACKDALWFGLVRKHVAPWFGSPERVEPGRTVRQKESAKARS
jgi:hypothetical protein